MRIHLPSLPAVLLTVARNQARHAKMREFFAAHGYGNVQWIFGRPTENHHHGAREMAIDTLRSISAPTLWLEDDATPTEHYTDEIEVPDDAQAVYLGGSRLGSKKRAMRSLRRHHKRGMISQVKKCLRGRRREKRRALYLDTPYRDWIQLVSMWTGHAILWLDDGLREAMARLIEKYPHKCYDIAWADQQWRWRIYAARHPLFFQDDGHNRHTQRYCR